MAGDILRFERHAIQLRSDLEAAERVVRDAKEELRGLDGEIDALSTIDVQDIRPIRATPRTTGSGHGEFVRELIRVLRAADGPVDMADLVREMASKFGVPFSTPEERRRAAYMVRRRLNELREKSAVVRLPTETGRRTGVWRWIAD